MFYFDLRLNRNGQSPEVETAGLDRGRLLAMYFL